MVQHVEEFRPELYSEPFVDWEIFSHSKVPGEQARAGEDVAAGVAEAAKRRRHEARRIEPLVDALPVRGQITVADPVRAGEESAGGTPARQKDREWRAGLRSKDAGQLPSSGYFFRERAGIRHKPAPASEGELINRAEREAMAEVEVGRAIVGAYVVRVLNVEAGFAG